MTNDQIVRRYGYINHTLDGLRQGFKPLNEVQYNALCDKIEAENTAATQHADWRKKRWEHNRNTDWARALAQTPE